MDKVRFGVVGLGNMGSFHVKYLPKMARAALGAVCDVDPVRLDKVAAGAGVPGYATHAEMIASGHVDAVLIAVPHYDHPPIATAAFAAGKHVLCEKPITVSIKQARRLADESRRHPHLKFGLMFQQRTEPKYVKVRDLVRSGELGEISRVTWIVTDWFRTWAYYASGGWRATWAGEGGGVLINQCPHNLDLLWWITGMLPARVTAVGAVGKTHPIEVEDEISAVMEYPNGAVGHFITTTGEAPGTNRLEVCGDRGKVVVEGGKVTFARTRRPVREIRETSPESFAHVETWPIEIPVPHDKGNHHQQVTEAFVNAVLDDAPMIAPGVEGVNGLELGNAMQMSALTGRPVDVPVDGDLYEQFLKDMAAKYGGRKATPAARPDAKPDTKVDMAASFR